MTKVKITLVKSVRNANKKHVATVQALGLRKIGQTVVHDASDSIMGMVRKVTHLIHYEEA